jgi:hypothetical protein
MRAGVASRWGRGNASWSAYEVGVPVTFGKIGTPLTSGVHFKSPFTNVTSFAALGVRTCRS